jgi:hypothetical protein
MKRLLLTLTTRPAAESANRRPKCNAKNDSSGVSRSDWPIANKRTPGKNMRAHDHTNKLDRGAGGCQIGHQMICRATNMALAAQAQDALELSLTSWGSV